MERREGALVLPGEGEKGDLGKQTGVIRKKARSTEPRPSPSKFKNEGREGYWNVVGFPWSRWGGWENSFVKTMRKYASMQKAQFLYVEGLEGERRGRRLGLL